MDKGSKEKLQKTVDKTVRHLLNSGSLSPRIKLVFGDKIRYKMAAVIVLLS